jgi:DNA-binding FadR family transcriptional regulator
MTEVHRVVDHTGRPKYVEVAESLRKSIARGQYPVGSELPSTARLTETFGVSTTVIRAAIRELRAEGLIIGQPGKAVYVRAEPDVIVPDVEQRLDELAAYMRDELASLSDRIAALERKR